MVSGFWATNTPLNETNLNKALIAVGSFASRPAAADEGRFYFALDTGLLYRDNGSTWDQVVYDDHASLPSLRTLGTGASQGAAGNHTHTISITDVATAERWYGDDGGYFLWCDYGDTESNSGVLLSITKTPGGDGSTVSLFGHAAFDNINNGDLYSMFVRLLKGGVEQSEAESSESNPSSSLGDDVVGAWVYFNEADPSASSTVYKLQARIDRVSCSDQQGHVISATLHYVEFSHAV